jgi:tellurite resistance protein
VLKGGLLYIGRGLKAIFGSGAEPALIDPSLPIAQEANCHIRGTEHWPAYHDVSPTARASYIQWLSAGKSDPEADVGYVFLYFYGLERRALSFSCFDPLLNKELSQIEGEIRRLLGIYDGNSSFGRYANSLLDFLVAKRAGDHNPQTLPALPQPRRHWVLPVEMRVALGLFAKENRPVPPEWAIRWYECMKTQASAYRLCREKFVELFKHLYTELHGEGIIIPTRPAKLTVLHQTASPSFGFASMVSVEFNLPDVSAYVGTDDAIRWIGSECSSSLSSYGRFITAHADKSLSIEAVSLLPSALWPDDFRLRIQNLRVAMESGVGCKGMALHDLFAPLDDASTLSRKAYAKLCTELESVGMNIEPDVRIGGCLPKLNEPIAVFVADRSPNATISDGYSTAALLVHLAGIVACAGKDFDDAEISVILHHLNDGFELTQAERARLAVQLRIYQVLPPTKTGLKQKIECLGGTAREAICDFLIQVSLADGSVDPEEVRVLEILFTLLDVDKSALYSRLHMAQAGAHDINLSGVHRPGANSITESLRFDMGKVASLRSESEKIAAILNDVFVETSTPEEPKTPNAQEHEETSEASVLGLDAEDAALLQVLIQRPQWARTEIEQICRGRNLMVDGAIERINDASFSRFDCAILEGDDPIDVNCELLAEEIV